MTFTRDQINSIDVGTKIAHGLGDGRFASPTEVTEIVCKREDIKGKLFVMGHRKFSNNSTISFSIKEGSEVDARIYRIEE